VFKILEGKDGFVLINLDNKYKNLLSQIVINRHKGKYQHCNIVDITLVRIKTRGRVSSPAIPTHSEF